MNLIEVMVVPVAVVVVVSVRVFSVRVSVMQEDHFGALLYDKTDTSDRQHAILFGVSGVRCMLCNFDCEMRLLCGEAVILDSQ